MHKNAGTPILTFAGKRTIAHYSFPAIAGNARHGAKRRQRATRTLRASP